MDKFTQQEIIQGCQKQNPRFQKALVVQYSGILMSVSRRYTRDDALAKDVLQEALIKILKSIPNYKDQGNFEAWLKRIVINCAITFINKSSFKNELYNIAELPEKSTAPEIYSSLASDELLYLIAQLPTTYSTVFNLFAVEGYSHKEISQMLEIEESTSRSQLTRARGMLRKLLLKSQKTRLII